MNQISVREAILRAADSIERAPDRYDFMSNDAPNCGTPLCMVGWIGVHLGVRESSSKSYIGAVTEAAGFGYSDLIDFWSSLRAENPRSIGMVTSMEPPEVLPANAAKLMRLFADARFPATEQPRRIDTVPDWKAIATARPALVGGGV